MHAISLPEAATCLDGRQEMQTIIVLASYIIPVIIKEISLLLENKNRKKRLSSEIVLTRLKMSRLKMANGFLVLLFFNHGNDMVRETNIIYSEIQSLKEMNSKKGQFNYNVKIIKMTKSIDT